MGKPVWGGRSNGATAGWGGGRGGSASIWMIWIKPDELLDYSQLLLSGEFNTDEAAVYEPVFIWIKNEDVLMFFGLKLMGLSESQAADWLIKDYLHEYLQINWTELMVQW